MNADIPTSICQWWTAAMPRTTDAAAALASLARHALPPEPKAPSDVEVHAPMELMLCGSCGFDLG